ncbi:hypothetical protein H4R33_005134 [Dimargaris cristalligena]|uniref:ATPase, F0 complex, subunit J n=1 Tax=Dimargaris cristalligena TaxID=215637 RepID=A0A4Q0A2P8_9FUNG|nr:hypothetical protein H4R33_005134 [Dimargaris cristalligena]RKP40347.1 hypothetical protein BJ085DRAFT_37240 [Dimargaris cristalligena]|eukprot:RKP40347.1 hypothetical protein BJ085DRAFT_37240 [Dimargaris cristalligena]
MAPRLFGMRAYPTPLLKPAHPFMIGAAITYYIFSGITESLSNSEMFRDHPDNPKLRYKKEAHH